MLNLFSLFIHLFRFISEGLSRTLCLYGVVYFGFSTLITLQLGEELCLSVFCLSVCLSAGTRKPLHQNFVRDTRGPAALRYATTCTSGFVDDVVMDPRAFLSGDKTR